MIKFTRMSSFPLEIVYQDESLVAINKPPGLLVHRTKIAHDATEFALQILRDQIGQKVFPIHRIDRKTSGVLLFAKHVEVVSSIQQVFTNHLIQKEYLAIVRGYFPDSIQLDHSLINEKGISKDAQTDFRCLEKTELPIALGKHPTSRYSLIAAYPKTGRMHQIRRHLNHLRHPIIGDRPHGCNKQNRLFLDRWNMKNMLLHAKKLSFRHPETEEFIEMVAAPSKVFLEMCEKLNFSTKRHLLE